MTQDQNDPIIRVEGVCKTFGSLRAVDNVSLSIQRGEFFALVGPSGCGKSTLLRMLAGFETPDAGRVFIDGRDMTGIGPNRRPVNLVFQSYAVFPHMSVAENVAYGLKIARRPHDEIAARTQEALMLVKLDGQEKKKPDELSGGQRQRVALARALIMRPAVLLLDEPLSALDAKLREAMQIELVHLQKTVGITFVIVTHDQSEALSMANRIAVMHQGAVRQIAGPAELYEAPNCRFVADFIGRINLFEGVAVPHKKGRLRIKSEVLGEIELDGQGAGAVTLAVRPEKIQISREAQTQEDTIQVRGQVADVAYYGGYSNIFIDAGAGPPIVADITNTGSAGVPRFLPGEWLWCSWRASDSLLFRD
ncbi:MAG: ABC transporter ATP-binding protein [Alphaproteobacteria bacterium]|nr:ABC transporter ATP-binding protein [Alphaproteobacteria bacterium]